MSIKSYMECVLWVLVDGCTLNICNCNAYIVEADLGTSCDNVYKRKMNPILLFWKWLVSKHVFFKDSCEYFSSFPIGYTRFPNWYWPHCCTGGNKNCNRGSHLRQCMKNDQWTCIANTILQHCSRKTAFLFSILLAETDACLKV